MSLDDNAMLEKLVEAVQSTRVELVEIKSGVTRVEERMADSTKRLEEDLSELSDEIKGYRGFMFEIEAIKSRVAQLESNNTWLGRLVVSLVIVAVVGSVVVATK